MMKIDFPETWKRCDGNAELLAATAVMVSEDAPVELQQLTEALQQEDASSAKASAHALKGMLATFEEGSAVSGLQKVEQASGDGNIADAQSHLDSILVEVATLIERIRSVSL